MGETWDFLLSEFRRFGGIADNVIQKKGKYGRGIFSINPSQKARIFTPKKLLIKKEDIFLENNKLRIKNDKEYDNISSIVVCGGVAANKYLRNQLNDLCENLNIDIIYPAPKYCTDNGVMVAWAGMERLIHDDYTIPPVPQSSLDRFQKLKLEQKNKMKKNENSEEDDYELLEFYPSWAL